MKPASGPAPARGREKAHAKKSICDAHPNPRHFPRLTFAACLLFPWTPCRSSSPQCPTAARRRRMLSETHVWGSYDLRCTMPPVREHGPPQAAEEGRLGGAAPAVQGRLAPAAARGAQTTESSAAKSAASSAEPSTPRAARSSARTLPSKRSIPSQAPPKWSIRSCWTWQSPQTPTCHASARQAGVHQRAFTTS